MKYLLDTNVLLKTRKQNGHENVRRTVAAIDDEDLFVSVISIGEISYGISRLERSKKRRDLEAWYSQLGQHFADRVLPISRDIAHLWGELTAEVAKRGRTINAADGLLAATALHHGLHLMTRNTSNFQATGVRVSSPWDTTN